MRRCLVFTLLLLVKPLRENDCGPLATYNIIALVDSYPRGAVELPDEDGEGRLA